MLEPAGDFIVDGPTPPRYTARVNAASDWPRYVAIEGPIGVGKTRLARALAARIGARLVLDRTAENPFLGDLHRDSRRHAFQSQVFFLLARSAQQEELRQEDMGGLISDYAFGRLAIYASLHLTPAEAELYGRLADHLRPVRRPDLVVYLQARADVLIERLRLARRALPRADYIEEVVRAYAEHFFLYEESPLLVVNTSDVDPSDAATVAEIEAAIRQARRGVSTYVPLASRQLSFG